ncbi:MAG: chorismate mutase [Saprospiraceae bacterium]
MALNKISDLFDPSWHLSGKRPFLISGPCSAETEFQTLETARRLAKTNKIHIFRSGIWKPRTRPGAFEGVGARGLPWLQEVTKETGLPVMVEVANASHVEMSLKSGINIFWIGARTTVNPFAVQEIAEALIGTDVTVFIKNPINPDLDLWLGGTERLINAGIPRIGAIHRGFSYSGEKIFRNRPYWQIAIDYKCALPNIPLINDPSHICGRRDLLAKVAQKAMDLSYDGLMIESHISPDDAWSDAAQQITPEVYEDLIHHLVIRRTEVDLKAEKDELLRKRKEIDLLDDELLHILASRMKIVRDIGVYKKEHNIAILQAERWSEIIQKLVSHGTQQGLSEEFITRFIKTVHDESIEQQENIMTPAKPNLKDIF